MKTRIAFLVRSLSRGGAERQLIDLGRGLDKREFAVYLLTFYRGGDLESEVTAETGITLLSLDKAGRYDILTFATRLLRTVRAVRPHIVHGYMGVANELSLLAGRSCGARVVWGLRATDIARSETVAGLCLGRLGAMLSGQPDRIIANSESVRAMHVARGYSGTRMIVIPNGIDTQRFAISSSAREAVRRVWGVTPQEVLVGRVARLHPMKDYPAFVRSAARVARELPAARFACVGDGTDCASLRDLAAQLGIAERMIWAGGRQDMSAVYNALDINVSSSMYGEGFPNVVAESMACGTPCVVTDVGDSAIVVHDTGIVVPPASPTALADGILRLSNSRMRSSREHVRRYITDRFDCQRLVTRTQEEFHRLMCLPGQARAGRSSDGLG